MRSVIFSAACLVAAAATITLPRSTYADARLLVFASTSSEYVGDCQARYRGLHVAQVIAATEADAGRGVGLTGTLERSGLFPATMSLCNTGGILPGTQFLACSTQIEMPCVNPSGPSYRARSRASFSDTPEQVRVNGDAHFIGCPGSNPVDPYPW